MGQRIRINKRKLARLCAKREIKELALFGSVLGENFRADSDIDILVTFRENTSHSVIDWLDTVDDLQSVFGGRKVDPVTDRGLRTFMRRKEIMKTRQIIFAG